MSEIIALEGKTRSLSRGDESLYYVSLTCSTGCLAIPLFPEIEELIDHLRCSNPGIRLELSCLEPQQD